MTASACPANDELRAFSAGLLAEAPFEQVTAHVEGCALCESALVAFDGQPDELVTHLRNTPRERWSVEAIPGDLLQAVRSLPVRSIQSRVSAGEPCHLGRFELLEELGTGSFGHVFRAR